MDNNQLIVTIVMALIGGGVSPVLLALIARKKVKPDIDSTMAGTIAELTKTTRELSASNLKYIKERECNAAERTELLRRVRAVERKREEDFARLKSLEEALSEYVAGTDLLSGQLTDAEMIPVWTAPHNK